MTPGLLLPLGGFLDDFTSALADVLHDAVLPLALRAFGVTRVTKLKVAAADQQRSAVARPRCGVAFGARFGKRSVCEPNGDRLQYELVINGRS